MNTGIINNLEWFDPFKFPTKLVIAATLIRTALNQNILEMSYLPDGKHGSDRDKLSVCGII